MVGYPFTDEVSHQFMGLVSPTERRRRAESVLRRQPEVRRRPRAPDAGRPGGWRSARATSAARTRTPTRSCSVTRELMGGNPTTFAGSDHGFAPQSLRGQRERGALQRRRPSAASSLHAEQREDAVELQRRRRRTGCPPRAATTDDITKACWAGGTIQIYINPTARSRPARPSRPTRRCGPPCENAFHEPHRPGEPGQAGRSWKIMNKEELRNVDGSDSLHPNRSGDVVVVLRPPYQSDAGTTEPGDRAVALLRPARLPAGQRRPGRTTSTCTRRSSLGGPAIKHKDKVEGPAGDRHRADDRVPDGHPRPAERARPDPLRPRRAHGEPARGHDPRHQRLPRPADPARRRRPTRIGPDAAVHRRRSRSAARRS